MKHGDQFSWSNLSQRHFRIIKVPLEGGQIGFIPVYTRDTSQIPGPVSWDKLSPYLVNTALNPLNPAEIVPREPWYNFRPVYMLV